MAPVTTYYLDMHGAADVRAKALPPHVTVAEATVRQFSFNRFLYQLVGAPWQWTDKLSWSDEEWRAWAEDPQRRLWVAYVGGSPAGYFELVQRTAADGEVAVEIDYFGLAPAFLGQGLGGGLLSHALMMAWAWPGTQRVWVHTCSLDHAAALANYQARGMRLYDTHVSE